MEKPLSIRLPPALRREIERLGRRQKRPVSDLAREALRRYVAVERFRAIRDRALPLAEAQGLLTDEDVFRAIS
ncbi:MAG: CopG family ribbon-helix-helix protein [Phycisphaerales bacterium]